MQDGTVTQRFLGSQTKRKAGASREKSTPENHSLWVIIAG